MNPPRILFVNYGNDSIALMQYVADQSMQGEVYVVSVDTGFAGENWSERVAAAEAYGRSLGWTVIRLQAKPDFTHLVHAQREFPTPKFQWCAVYLKGDSIRQFLAEHDPLKQALILLPRRRAHSPALQHLQEIEHGGEDYDQRTVCCPLFLHTDEAMQALALRSPLPFLSHRSLECDPCVNSRGEDLARALQSAHTAQRLHDLEKQMDLIFIDPAQPVKTTCCSRYGCGL